MYLPAVYIPQYGAPNFLRDPHDLVGGHSHSGGGAGHHHPSRPLHLHSISTPLSDVPPTSSYQSMRHTRTYSRPMSGYSTNATTPSTSDHNDAYQHYYIGSGPATGDAFGPPPQHHQPQSAWLSSPVSAAAYDDDTAQRSDPASGNKHNPPPCFNPIAPCTSPFAHMHSDPLGPLALPVPYPTGGEDVATPWLTGRVPPQHHHNLCSPLVTPCFHPMRVPPQPPNTQSLQSCEGSDLTEVGSGGGADTWFTVSDGNIAAAVVMSASSAPQAIAGLAWQSPSMHRNDELECFTPNLVPATTRLPNAAVVPQIVAVPPLMRAPLSSSSLISVDSPATFCSIVDVLEQPSPLERHRAADPNQQVPQDHRIDGPIGLSMLVSDDAEEPCGPNPAHHCSDALFTPPLRLTSDNHNGTVASRRPMCSDPCSVGAVVASKLPPIAFDALPIARRDGWGEAHGLLLSGGGTSLSIPGATCSGNTWRTATIVSGGESSVTNGLGNTVAAAVESSSRGASGTDASGVSVPRVWHSFHCPLGTVSSSRDVGSLRGTASRQAHQPASCTGMGAPERAASSEGVPSYGAVRSRTQVNTVNPSALPSTGLPLRPGVVMLPPGDAVQSYMADAAVESFSFTPPPPPSATPAMVRLARFAPAAPSLVSAPHCCQPAAAGDAATGDVMADLFAQLERRVQQGRAAAAFNDGLMLQ